MTNMFISAVEIKELRDVSYKTSCKIFNSIVKKFNLPKERELSVKSYCEYYNLREDQVYRDLDILRASKKKSA